MLDERNGEEHDTGKDASDLSRLDCSPLESTQDLGCLRSASHVAAHHLTRVKAETAIYPAEGGVRKQIGKADAADIEPSLSIYG